MGWFSDFSLLSSQFSIPAACSSRYTYYTDRMRCASACLVALTIAVPVFAQARKPVRKTPPPPAASAVKKVAPDMSCPAPLGVGARTKLAFCEVMAGRDPAGGVIIQVPPHKGPATLTFDLHNLHTYSEEQVKAHRAYARYTATIGVLTMDNTLVSRAVVQNEFRKAGDPVDRVGGGAGPREPRRRIQSTERVARAAPASAPACPYYIGKRPPI